MIVKAWNGGNNGAGYGIRVRRIDRDEYFFPEWKQVQIQIVDGPLINCNLSASFWNNTCYEIRNVAFRDWFIKLGFVKRTQEGYERAWKKGVPPKFDLIHISDNLFTLSVG